MHLDLSIRRSELNLGQITAMHSQSPVVLLAGGFGSGKTTGIGLKSLQLKLLNGRAPGMISAHSWSALWSTTWPSVLSVWRKSLPKDVFRKASVVRDRAGACYVDWGDGAPIFLRSARHPDSIDSLNLGWSVNDELRHWRNWHSFEVTLARVRVPCALSQSVFASTPAIGPMANEFNTGKEDRQTIRMPTRENARNLSPNYIKNIQLSYSKRMQRALLEGFFVPLEGSVYENLDPDIWNSAWAIDYDPYETQEEHTILSIDPGYQHSSWLFWRELPNPPMGGKRPCWVLFDQLQLDRKSDAEAVAMVNARRWEIDEIWIDPAADNTQSAYNLDTLEMVKGIKCRKGVKDPVHYITGPFRSISFGVDKVRTTLGSPDIGIPIRLYFAKYMERWENEWARGCVKDLLGYTYPETKPGHPVSDKPIKDGTTDHSNDALRMFVVGRWLCDPSLFRIDPRLPAMVKHSPGFRVAA